MSLNMAERLVSDTQVIGKGGENEYLLQDFIPFSE